jgi:hypothetical protein
MGTSPETEKSIYCLLCRSAMHAIASAHFDIPTSGYLDSACGRKKQEGERASRSVSEEGGNKE